MTNQPLSSVCPRCRQPLVPKALFCSHCGQPLTATAPRPIAPQIRLPACIACAHPDTQKVSAIVQASSWYGTSSGQMSGVGFVPGGGMAVMGGATSSQTAIATHLAMALAPPPPPHYSADPGGGTLLGLIVLACIFGLMTFSVFAMEATNPVWLITGSIFLGCVVGAVRQSKENKANAYLDWQQHSFAEQRWKAAYAVWDRLYYCARCDHVFDPVTNRYVRSGAIAALYQ